MAKKPTKRETQLQYLEIKKLAFLRRNPQFLTPSQMSALKESIKRDGFLSPILVRPISKNRFEIISGNHRALAAQENGIKSIPAIICDLTDQQAKRIAINLNTVHGDPPAELLAPFLSELDDESLALIHLDDDLMRDIVSFDSQLEKRLSELEPVHQLDNDSVRSALPSCVCSTCGRKHAKPENV